ncbi:MAG: polyprenyl synthetase family protein [Candidatus Bathyarchaeota archaeon]|nr:polyprenyl synthetase family protein [Candidatus Bathyarchaeota archaeon]
MNTQPELMEIAKVLIEKRGKNALEKAQKEILECQYNGGAVSSALKYFADVIFPRALPVFPALVSLSCEVVGGKPERTVSTGAALTLMAAAADIHDDIIDQSKIKYSKKTVFGKFGGDIAVLAGDALLIQGMTLLYKECELLDKKQRETVQSLVLEAFFEISRAQIKEVALRRRTDITPQEYFEIIKLKAVIPEIHCKIGAILGNANEQTVQYLGQYGRSLGVVSIVRDEFIDLLEYDELQSRIRNENPPLPMIYALQNPEMADKIKAFAESGLKITKKDANRMIKIVLDSPQVQELKQNLQSIIKEGLNSIVWVKNAQLKKELTLLLTALMERL